MMENIEEDEKLSNMVDSWTSNMAQNQTNELEGTFKANEVDVVYVTAPGGYKFRFKFNFEWELIEIPGNGTTAYPVYDQYTDQYHSLEFIIY